MTAASEAARGADEDATAPSRCNAAGDGPDSSSIQFTDVRLDETSNNSASQINTNNINANNHSSNNNSQKAQFEPVSHPSKGWVRHLVAVLALSSIVLANMNRQAFDQALIGVTRTAEKRVEPMPPNSTIPITTTLASLLDETTTTKLPETTTGWLSTTTRPETTTGRPDTTTTRPETTTSARSDGDTTTREDSVSTTTSMPDDDVEEGKVLFDWDGPQIATLQAAFYYGYTPFMIPGGRMSELYGAKWVMFISGFGSALCSVLAPFFADTNYYLLVASRVMIGLCQTGVSPALYALLTRWLPAEESSVYLPLIKVAVMVGFMLGSLVGGLFSWHLTFYLSGLVSILWSVMWVFTVSSDPGEHNFISKRELAYIRRELQRAHKDDGKSAEETRKSAAPWFQILTNPVVLSFMVAKFTIKLSTSAQSSQIPMYLKLVFRVDDKFNGVLSALNFAIQSIFTGMVAWYAKEFVVNKWFGLSKTGVRRLFQGICNFGMALSYLLLTFNMSSLSVAICSVILLSITAMFGAGGEAVTPVDLSVNYAASIMAIANSSANFSGIVLPSIVSYILGNQRNSTERWNLCWYVISGIVAGGGFIYSFLVTGELQDFSKDESRKAKDDYRWGSDDRKEGVYRKVAPKVGNEMLKRDVQMAIMS